MKISNQSTVRRESLRGSGLKNRDTWQRVSRKSVTSPAPKTLGQGTSDVLIHEPSLKQVGVSGDSNRRAPERISSLPPNRNLRTNRKATQAKNSRATIVFSAPSDVRAGLRQYAAREDRSVTSLIVHLCRRALMAKGFMQ